MVGTWIHGHVTGQVLGGCGIFRLFYCGCMVLFLKLVWMALFFLRSKAHVATPRGCLWLAGLHRDKQPGGCDGHVVGLGACAGGVLWYRCGSADGSTCAMRRGKPAGPPPE